MSYILEALKKAERERGLGQVPSLATQYIPNSPSRPRFWHWLAITALLSALLAIGAAVLLSIQKSAQTQQASSSVQLESEPQKAKAASKAASAETLVQSSQAAPDSAPSTQPLAPQLAAARKPEPPPVRANPLEAAPLRSLPAEFQSAVPTLNLDIHVYSEAAAERFVLINSKRYQEGDRLSEGPVLEAITARGVILRHKGRRFSLALNR